MSWLRRLFSRLHARLRGSSWQWQQWHCEGGFGGAGSKSMSSETSRKFDCLMRQMDDMHRNCRELGESLRQEAANDGKKR